MYLQKHQLSQTSFLCDTHSRIVLYFQLLEAGDRISIDGNTVQIRALERTDGGVYTCTFKNIVGQVSHIIKLVIEGEFLLASLFV